MPQFYCTTLTTPTHFVNLLDLESMENWNGDAIPESALPAHVAQQIQQEQQQQQQQHQQDDLDLEVEKIAFATAAASAQVSASAPASLMNRFKSTISGVKSAVLDKFNLHKERLPVGTRPVRALKSPITLYRGHPNLATLST